MTTCIQSTPMGLPIGSPIGILNRHYESTFSTIRPERERNSSLS